MDIGLLLLRIALAAILYMHATQKLFGWFSGPGLDRAGMLFDGLGQRPGRRMAMVAVACEATGSVLVVLGLATPLGAAILAGTMAVAGAALTMAKGTVWNVLGGGEYPLVLAAFAIVLGFAGPGRWSVDAAIGAPWITHSNTTAAITGVTVVVAAVIAAIPALLRTRANLR
jgi:putative oxidoreductase